MDECPKVAPRSGLFLNRGIFCVEAAMYLFPQIRTVSRFVCLNRHILHAVFWRDILFRTVYNNEQLLYITLGGCPDETILSPLHDLFPFAM